ncbi:MAG: general secretion pathway protein GspK [Pseudomonadota bacterium]
MDNGKNALQVLTDAGERITVNGYMPALKKNGIALIAVLWVIALLTVMALEFSYAMRTEVDIWTNYKDELKGYFLARAGVERALLEITRFHKTGTAVLAQENGEEEKPEEENELWVPDGSPHEVSMNEGDFKVSVEDEGGKLNINRASEDALRDLMGNLDIPPEEAGIIADSILDWRDQDNLHRLNGAEDDYYAALPDPYECKDGEFDAVEELLLVKGITPEIYRKFADKLTVYTQNDTINVNTASPAVLRWVIPDNQIVDQILEQRPFQTPQELQIVKGDTTTLAPVGISSSSGFYTVKSTGRIKGSKIARSVKAVVQIKGPESSIVTWTDRWWEIKDNAA